jgi:hypothetical protein
MPIRFERSAVLDKRVGLTIAKTWSPVSLVDFVVGGTTGSRMPVEGR